MGQTDVAHLERRLGSDRLDVRLGAVYALERVMIDAAPDHPAIVELLAAFVGERFPAAASAPGPDDGQRSRIHVRRLTCRRPLPCSAAGQPDEPNEDE